MVLGLCRNKCRNTAIRIMNIPVFHASDIRNAGSSLVTGERSETTISLKFDCNKAKCAQMMMRGLRLRIGSRSFCSSSTTPRFGGVDHNLPIRDQEDDSRIGLKRAVPLKQRVGEYGAGWRVNRFLSHSGKCSRREADRWIDVGRITVNHEKVAPGYILAADDVVKLDDSIVKLVQTQKMWLYYKKKGEIVSTQSQTAPGKKEGFNSMFHTIKKKFPGMNSHFTSVGRLDANSEGLMILTNTPSMSGVLECPDNGLKRVYKVRAHGLLFEKRLGILRSGFSSKGLKYKPMDVEVLKGSGTNVWLQIGLTEGKKNEIRVALQHIGLTTNRLIRTTYGPYSLGDMQPGELRPVHIEPEIKKLYQVFASKVQKKQNNSLY